MFHVDPFNFLTEHLSETNVSDLRGVIVLQSFGHSDLSDGTLELKIKVSQITF